MDPSRELVDAGQMGIVLAALSAAGALGAVLAGVVARTRGAHWRRAALLCATVVLLWPLWLIYNSIEDRFGLESIAALVLNAVIFLAVGTAAGVLLRRGWAADAGGAASSRQEVSGRDGD